MHALAEDVDAQRTVDQAAQRARHPELVVVARARVERDDEADLAHPWRERVEICGQVVAAALLASLDEADASWMRIERFDGRDRGEHRVAVVGAPAPVQPAIFDHRRPGTEALAPSGHLRLLVEVAIEDDRSRRRAGSAPGHVEEEHGRAPFQSDHLELEACHARRLHPPARLLDHLVDMAVPPPIGIEMRALRRNADVVDELRDDLVVPMRVDAVHGTHFSMLPTWLCRGSRSSWLRTRCG